MSVFSTATGGHALHCWEGTNRTWLCCQIL